MMIGKKKADAMMQSAVSVCTNNYNRNASAKKREHYRESAFFSEMAEVRYV